jgi:hypothetical protein
VYAILVGLKQTRLENGDVAITIEESIFDKNIIWIFKNLLADLGIDLPFGVSPLESTKPEVAAGN